MPIGMTSITTETGSNGHTGALFEGLIQGDGLLAAAFRFLSQRCSNILEIGVTIDQPLELPVFIDKCHERRMAPQHCAGPARARFIAECFGGRFTRAVGQQASEE